MCSYNSGFGGSNSAIILEEAPSRSAASHNGTNGVNNTNGFDGTNGIENTFDGVGNGHNDGLRGESGLNGTNVGTWSRRLFIFSAKTQKSLTSYLTSFKEYLDEAPMSSDFFRDLSYTLGQRRTHYPYRVSAVASSVGGLQEKLSTLKPNRIKDRTHAFVFTGQGAQ